jgi:hypothetical protein
MRISKKKLVRASSRLAPSARTNRPPGSFPVLPARVVGARCWCSRSPRPHHTHTRASPQYAPRLCSRAARSEKAAASRSSPTLHPTCRCDPTSASTYHGCFKPHTTALLFVAGGVHIAAPSIWCARRRDHAGPALAFGLQGNAARPCAPPGCPPSCMLVGFWFTR